MVFVEIEQKYRLKDPAKVRVLLKKLGAKKIAGGTETNEFFDREAPELGVEPLSAKEVKSYYREDALIWKLYLSMRKTDRFLKTRLSRKGYPYILPGKIKR